MNHDDPWLRDLQDLKRLPRSGWFWVGVERPESVAEHSYATGLLAWRLARREGLDAEKCLLMGLLHDFHEVRLGDIPTPFKRAIGQDAVREAEASVEAEQWGGDSQTLELLEELRLGESGEARLVRAVDELELLLQALRYLRAGRSEAAAFLVGASEGEAARHPATAALAAAVLEKAGR
jgi:putative hydrolase of HD superfamily